MLLQVSDLRIRAARDSSASADCLKTFVTQKCGHAIGCLAFCSSQQLVVNGKPTKVRLSEWLFKTQISFLHSRLCANFDSLSPASGGPKQLIGLPGEKNRLWLRPAVHLCDNVAAFVTHKAENMSCQHLTVGKRLNADVEYYQGLKRCSRWFRPYTMWMPHRETDRQTDSLTFCIYAEETAKNNTQ